MKWTVLSIFFTLLLLTMLFAIPAVQSRAAKWTVSWVNNRFETQISIDRLQFVLPDQIIIKNLYLPDRSGDTIVFASEADVHFGGYFSETKSAKSSGVQLHDLKFYWQTLPGDSVSSFMQFVDKIDGDDNSSSAPFGLTVEDIEITNGRYLMEDLNCDSCFSFFLTDLNLAVSSFKMKGSSIALDLNSLRAKDQRSVDIESLTTHFEMDSSQMHFEALKFKTAESNFDGDLHFAYQGFPDFKSFTEKVALKSSVKTALVNQRELQFFAADYPNFGTVKLKGQMEGLVEDFELKNVELSLGNQTKIRARELVIKNTLQTDSLYFKAKGFKYQSSRMESQRWMHLFSESPLPKQLETLSDIKLIADFNGYWRNFETDIDLQTNLGDVSLQLELNIWDSLQPPVYRASLSTSAFDLATLLQQPKLGIAQLQAKLDGEGFSIDELKTSLQGQIQQLEFNNYVYSGIAVNGHFERSLFNGDLAINDPNFKFNFSGLAGFEADTSTYNGKAVVHYADLHKLHFIDDTIALAQTEVNLNFKALNYDKWVGTVALSNSTYESPARFYFFNEIFAQSSGFKGDREFLFESDLADFNLSGEYSFSGIKQALLSQYSQLVKTKEWVKPPHDQNFDFGFFFNNTELVSELFVPQLKLEANTTIEGHYESESNTLTANVESGEIWYQQNAITNIELFLKASQEKTQLRFDLGSIQLANQRRFDSVQLGNYIFNDTLFYDLSGIFRDSVDSRISVLGYAIQDDTLSYELGFLKGNFNVGYQDFVFNDKNRIVIDTGGAHIHNFVLSHQDEHLFVNGNISKNQNEILRLGIENFSMDLPNYLLGSRAAKFDGSVSGEVILSQLLLQPKFAAEIDMDSLTINQSWLGNLSLASDWMMNSDSVFLRGDMERGELSIFDGEGVYVTDSLGQLNIVADFNRFKLNALDPFLEDITQDNHGFLSGSLKLTGNSFKPKLNGVLQLADAGFKVGFLQTEYTFIGNPQLELVNSELRFDKLRLRDSKYLTQALLKGDLTHQNFTDFNLNLHIDANDFLVLDTDSKSEDPYYGTAFVSGTIDINGPLDDILIKANVTSEKNTEFYLPIDGATEVEEVEFVHFVDYSNVDNIEEVIGRGLAAQASASGVSIDFNMTINPSASIGIIIDREIGNILVSRGFGNLQLTMDQFGEMGMFGTYTVHEGFYNFVFATSQGTSFLSLQRKFELLRGGTVVWNGDPLEALINVTGRYQTKADPTVLVPSYTGGRTLTIVDLSLQGDLMDPDINFDISTPRAGNSIQSVIDGQLTEIDVMYKQVFSLLAINQFAPNEGLDYDVNDNRSLALSALASQATNYLNQLTGDYQFSLGYQVATDKSNRSAIDAAKTTQSSDELEVGVSKRFFDERVVVNTSLGVAVGEVNDDQSQLAGDFEIVYNVTKDGRIRAKVFNRSIQNQTYNPGSQNYQQGLGLFYSVDFENGKDLKQKVFGKKDSLVEVPNGTLAKPDSLDQDSDPIPPENL